MKSKILVIEDEPDMAMGLRDNLEFEGYEVLTAASGEDGLEVAVEEKPDCILLDIMLPGIDGFETCRRLRKKGIRAPVLMLTARGQEVDKVYGLELGADDYITKPFSLKELVARIRASLRRYTAETPSDAREEFQLGDVKIDLSSSRIARGEEELPLGHYEGCILKLLRKRAGDVVDRTDLLKEIWGLENEPLNRSVDNHVVSLRRKIEENPSSPRHIITVHGVGYKLVL